MMLHPSPAEWLASQPDLLKRQIKDLPEATRAALNWRWRDWWARPSQLAPDGDWRVWMFMAGRGAGKTRAGAEWVREQVKAGRGRISLIAPTAADARDVMVEGNSGLLSVCWAGDTTQDGTHLGRPVYEPSKRRVTWANGAMATLFSADEPERLRGPQSDALWADELASWRRPEAWDMAMFGLRLGDDPRAIVTTTPKPTAFVRRLAKDPGTHLTRGSTFDNAANLAPSAVAKLRQDYEGTRLGRQELYAEILDDLPGALFDRANIDEHRRPIKDGKTARETAPDMQRIVVAIDPSGTGGADDDGDSIGIVVAGKGIDGRGYVFADRSCKLSPDGWARRAVAAYREFGADRIVAERNYGGAMVEAVIRTADRKVSYKEVTATRGKVVRAEPVAALYEQGRVSHVGAFDALEDQMCLMGPDGFIGEGSPDRLDALVWAMTELMLKPEPAFQWSMDGLTDTNQQAED